MRGVNAMAHSTTSAAPVKVNARLVKPLHWRTGRGLVEINGEPFICKQLLEMQGDGLARCGYRLTHRVTRHTQDVRFDPAWSCDCGEPVCVHTVAIRKALYPTGYGVRVVLKDGVEKVVRAWPDSEEETASRL